MVSACQHLEFATALETLLVLIAPTALMVIKASIATNQLVLMIAQVMVFVLLLSLAIVTRDSVDDIAKPTTAHTTAPTEVIVQMVYASAGKDGRDLNAQYPSALEEILRFNRAKFALDMDAASARMSAAVTRDGLVMLAQSPIATINATEMENALLRMFVFASLDGRELLALIVFAHKIALATEYAWLLTQHSTHETIPQIIILVNIATLNTLFIHSKPHSPTLHQLMSLLTTLSSLNHRHLQVSFKCLDSVTQSL